MRWLWLPVSFVAVCLCASANTEGPWLDGRLRLADRTTPHEGMQHLLVQSQAKDEETIFEAHVLLIDPARFRLQPALALNQTVGREATSSIARRHGATAAVNGGFFSAETPYVGDPALVYAFRGNVVSEPQRSRAALALWEERGRQAAYIGHPEWEAYAMWGRPSHRIDLNGVNRGRGDEDVVWFNPLCHRSTLTVPGGTEVVVAGGRVVNVRDGYGDSTIPATGGVLSFSAARWKTLPARSRPRVGDPFRAVTRLVGDGDAEVWRRAEYVVNGIPALVHEGAPIPPGAWHEQGLKEGFTVKKHPRTAIGWTTDGTWILVVVDGRQEKISMGIDLPDLARFMIELGAVEAMNLDGGGSSTMVLDGEVRNHPSDGSERLVSDALLVMPGMKP